MNELGHTASLMLASLRACAGYGSSRDGLWFPVNLDDAFSHLASCVSCSVTDAGLLSVLSELEAKGYYREGKVLGADDVSPGLLSILDAALAPKLSKRARDVEKLMSQGAYWRKQLETQYRGGEKFVTRLYMSGHPVRGYGFSTFTEMDDAGLLQWRESEKSTVYPSEWTLREVPLKPVA